MVPAVRAAQLGGSEPLRLLLYSLLQGGRGQGLHVRHWPAGTAAVMALCHSMAPVMGCWQRQYQ